MESLWDSLVGQSMPPHGHCYLWNDGLVYTHAISDAFIALAYFTIPIALYVLVRKREDLSFNYMFILFAVFIFACGATHLMALFNIWNSAYWLSGIIKIITALASVFTAILIWPLIPSVLALPSNKQLVAMNEQLRKESGHNREQTREVTRLTRELRELVQKRTQELEETRQIKVLLEEKNKELEASNEALEQFAQMASSDLQEPVNTITNMGELLTQKLESRLDEETGQWLRYLNLSSKRLGDLINGLQSFTFLTTDKGRQEDVSLDDMLDVALEELKTVIDENDVQVERTSLPVVHGNPMQLQKLVENLLSNAIKFSRHSSPPKIEIGSLEETREGEFGFYVKDNGIGIPVEYKDKIFGMFERVRDVQEFEGSGIGLAICKKVLEQHGGRAEVHSVLGEGSEIRIYFTPVMSA